MNMHIYISGLLVVLSSACGCISMRQTDAGETMVYDYAACMTKPGVPASHMYSALDYCLAHGGDSGFSLRVYERLQTEYPDSKEAKDARERFWPVIQKAEWGK